MRCWGGGELLLHYSKSAMMWLSDDVPITEQPIRVLASAGTGLAHGIRWGLEALVAPFPSPSRNPVALPASA